jgi:hypothetical protein
MYHSNEHFNMTALLQVCCGLCKDVCIPIECESAWKLQSAGRKDAAGKVKYELQLCSQCFSSLDSTQAFQFKTINLVCSAGLRGRILNSRRSRFSAPASTTARSGS